jgi:hypothetical protein
MVVSVGSRTRYYENGTSVTCLGIVCPLGKSNILIYPHGYGVYHNFQQYNSYISAQLFLKIILEEIKPYYL